MVPPIEQTFLHFASPALCGIKPASLFSMRQDVFEANRIKIIAWQKEFQRLNKQVAIIRRSQDLFLLFVADGPLLFQTLCVPASMQYLARKGYPVEAGCKAVLAELYLRLAAGGTQFPHEIGLFLGYPLADVQAFEADAGVNSIYTGYWQVYGDVSSAHRKMREYERCSSECCRLLTTGLNVPEICKRYCSSLKSPLYKEAC